MELPVFASKLKVPVGSVIVKGVILLALTQVPISVFL